MKYTHSTGTKTTTFSCFAEAHVEEGLFIIVGKEISAKNQDIAAYEFEQSLDTLGLNLEFIVKVDKKLAQ